MGNAGQPAPEAEVIVGRLLVEFNKTFGTTIRVNVLQRFAGEYESRISKRFSLLWFAVCRPVLRSRWCQNGIRSPWITERWFFSSLASSRNNAPAGQSVVHPSWHQRWHQLRCRFLTTRASKVPPENAHRGGAIIKVLYYSGEFKATSRLPQSLPRPNRYLNLLLDHRRTHPNLHLSTRRNRHYHNRYRPRNRR